MGIQILVYSGARFGPMFFVMCGFPVSCLISSALNGFRSFSPTFIYLSLFSIVIFVFVSANKGMAKPMIHAVFAGTIMFLFTFILVYRSELIHLSFSRLGGVFGDENDIALFNSIGMTLALYYLVYSKNLYNKLIFGFLAILFAFCSFASGSKIIVLVLGAMVVFLLLKINGKRRWWLTLIELAVCAGLFVGLLALPAFESLRVRVLSMISLFVPQNIRGTYRDGSTITRFYMFIDGMQLFLRKPLFGFGLGGFASRGGIMNGWSHNHISEMLCNTGLVGFVLYHLPFVYSLLLTRKNRSGTLWQMLLLLFAVQMVSVALASEKFFAFTIGIVYGALIEDKCVFEIQPTRFWRGLWILSRSSNR